MKELIKIKALLILLICYLGILSTSAREVSLDFNDPTLQMVLDNGLHPYRVPGAEDERLGFTRSDLRIILPGHKPVELQAYNGSMNVWTDYRISLFQCTGVSQSLEEGAAAFRRICKAWGCHACRFGGGHRGEDKAALFQRFPGR